MNKFLCVVAVVMGVVLSSFNIVAARAAADTATPPKTSKSITLDDLLGVPTQTTVTTNTTTNTIKK